MKLSDGTVLMHGKTPYDPKKAHDYYMRTRHLKGRKKGSSYTVTKNNHTYTLTAHQLEEQKAYAAMRVSKITARLNELRSKLQERMREAQKKKVSVDKKPTAADKSKEKRQAKQYRQSHRQELSNKAKTRRVTHPKTKTTTHKDPVAELERKITEVKNRLEAAVQTQRALMGATRN
jgi:hypothetical protein